ncbi:MAG: inorganic phosphate transporter [Candidatus Nanohaloarchaea archaeon]
MIELIFAFALIASVFMGISIGASSVAPSFAPANSASKFNVMQLALLAGIFAFIGSIVQGQNVADTVGAGLLFGEISVLQGAVILTVGAGLVITSVLTDYPMPTAFTIVGAVIGSGIGFGNAVNWNEFAMVLGFWVGTPIFSLIVAYALAKIMRRYIPKEGSEKMINYLLLLSGSYVAYTAGAASVGLAVGPLQSTGFEITSLLFLGGASILIGSWMISPRIIKAVAYDYSNVGPRRSVAALATSGILAQIGIQLGAPVSFNLAIVAAVIGSGLVEGTGNKSDDKIYRTLAAWIGAFMLSVLLTASAGILLT